MFRLSAFLILSFLLVRPALLRAQTCEFSFSGIVRDEAGNLLPGATLFLADKSTSTSSTGEFSFNAVCAGDAELIVRYIGYTDLHQKISITKDLRIELSLTPSETALETLEISGNKTSSALTNISFRLSAEELEHFSGKSLGEALKRVPGVNALQTGPAIFKPVIDGLHSQRILVLNNGIRQEGQQWGIEHAPEIDPFIASEIKVVKGSEAVRYGSDAMGGVIIVDTPPLHQAQKFGGELNAGIFSNNRMGVFSGLLEGGFKKFENISWRIQSSVKKGGDYSTPDYVLSNTGVRELNFSGALGVVHDHYGIELYISSFNTEIGILRAAHTGSLADLDDAIRNDRPWYIEDFTYSIQAPRQKINHQLIKVSAFKKFKHIGTLHLLYGAQYNQRKEFDIRRGGRSDTPALSLDLFTNTLDVFLDHKLGGLEGSVGVNGTFKDNSNVPGTGMDPLIPNYRQASGGLFLHEKLRKKSWLLEAGVRFDYQFLNVIAYTNNNQDLMKPKFNFGYVSGSVGASYYLNEYSRLSSHLGVASRPPHVSELYSDGLHRGTAAIERGIMMRNGFETDQSLIHKETSTKFTEGFQLMRKNFSIELSAHINHISNYVYLKPVGTELRRQGLFPLFEYRQTNALLTGIDGLVHADLAKHFEYTGTFAYLYAKDVTRNDVLIFIPPAQMEHALTYRTTTVREQDFFVTVSIPVVFKQNRAPVTIYPSNITPEMRDNTFDFAPAPDAYALLNASMGVKLPLKERELSISLEGQNLLNTSYRSYMNRLRYFADEPGRNFVLRIKYNFHSHE